jgi:hypothetical protein
LLAGVCEARVALPPDDGADVDVVGRAEELRLVAGEHLEVAERAVLPVPSHASYTSRDTAR